MAYGYDLYFSSISACVWFSLSVNLLLLDSLLDLHVDQRKRYFLPLVLLGHFSIWCVFVFELAFGTAISSRTFCDNGNVLHLWGWYGSHQLHVTLEHLKCNETELNFNKNLNINGHVWLMSIFSHILRAQEVWQPNCSIQMPRNHFFSSHPQPPVSTCSLSTSLSPCSAVGSSVPFF